MQFKLSVLALAIAMASLPACSKQEEQPAEKTKASEQTSKSPFQRNGELLTVNVDAMPRELFVAKMAELTGVKITAEGDNTQPVTVHAVDVTLRKVLSMAVADAPYAVTMQYTNLQDSFPATVSITRYKGGVTSHVAPAPLPAADRLSTAGSTASESAPVSAPVQSASEEPDLMTMGPDERVTFFLGQSAEEQTSIIFNMEPTTEESEFMTVLMAKPEVTGEVKMEMLDSLSSGDYEAVSAAINIALDSENPEVAAKAAETLGGIGSAKDIRTLKALVEKTDNDDVRTAATEAIETLEP